MTRTVNNMVGSRSVGRSTSKEILDRQSFGRCSLTLLLCSLSHVQVLVIIVVAVVANAVVIVSGLYFYLMSSLALLMMLLLLMLLFCFLIL